MQFLNAIAIVHVKAAIRGMYKLYVIVHYLEHRCWTRIEV